MATKTNQPAPAIWKLVLAFALVYIIWGSTYLTIRIAVASIPPFIMAGTRFLVAGIILFIVAKASGAPMPTRIEWRSGLIIGGLLLLGGNGGVSWAEQKLPSSLAALLVATVPMWMALFEWLRPGGTRPGWRAIVGLVIGFGGMIVLVDPNKILAGTGVDLLSVGVITLATMLWAIGSIYSRTSHAKLPESPLMATAAEMLAASVLIIAFAGITGEFNGFNVANVTTDSMLALGYLIVFGSLVAYTSYVWLLQVSTPARVSTYAYVNPIVAVALGWLILSEPLTTEMAIATPLILAAVVLITTSRAKQVTPVAEEPEIAIPVPQKASVGLEK
jgi:drug/metabolite transporter (DMT)-like permease